MRKSLWTSLWRGVDGLGNGVGVTDIHARPGNRLNSTLLVVMNMRLPVGMSVAIQGQTRPQTLNMLYFTLRRP